MGTRLDCPDFGRIARARFESLRVRYRLDDEVVRESPTDCSITFASVAAGLRLRWEPAERYVFLSIHKISDGVVAEFPQSVDDATRINAFDLDTILEAQGVPGRVGQIDRHAVLTKELLDDVLGRLAVATETHLTSLLAGDFAEFDDFAVVVRTRAELWRRRGTMHTPTRKPERT